MYKKIIIALSLSVPVLAHAQSLQPQDKLKAAMNAIKKYYVDSLSDKTLVEAAIKGMFTELDPHSKYFSKNEAKAMTSAMRGNFVGVGIEYMMQNDTVYVTQILPDGPAEKAGLLPGDRILKINKENAAGVKKSYMDILNAIRGENKTVVNLEIYRPAAKETMDFAITRGPVIDRSVTAAYMLDDKKTGYIAIRIFSQSTVNEIENALKKLKQEGMQQLILDLQGNGGGYVQAALGVADEFLKRNQLVYYVMTQDKGKDYYYASQSGTSWGGKLAVLVDQNTASASEILSGALQDWDRAVIVGRRTFGKGLTQQPIALPDSSVLELTGGRLYTPAGRSVQKPYKGVDYQADIRNRYTTGELFKESTRQKADSLKFKTLVNKRIVYAGGGITPDKFVPLDSLQDASWLRSVASAGYVNNASWKIADTQRQEIKKQYPDITTYIANYKVPKSTINDIVKSAEKQGFKLGKENKKRILDLLALEIKGQVANQVYVGRENYLRVINTENDSINEALKILDSTPEYNAYLEGKTIASTNK
ncbi:S41 family peptidase [Mucilaginibacter sp. RS28]|uniref:S41 family peptidase n=1 Tax=Mucilaginibacter straminoryzae TaxID=2932774 RepID=A0A9X1X0E3_9SPHI|nr:S41 family peptidase [Mucilaginibacter straminoryzae]MCJ8208854.1 S41 family peptidase [Mucilaginibacter straminoryzae]